MGCAGMERIKIGNDKGTVARSLTESIAATFTIRKCNSLLLTQKKQIYEFMQGNLITNGSSPLSGTIREQGTPKCSRIGAELRTESIVEYTRPCLDNRSAQPAMAARWSISPPAPGYLPPAGRRTRRPDPRPRPGPTAIVERRSRQTGHLGIRQGGDRQVRSQVCRARGSHRHLRPGRHDMGRAPDVQVRQEHKVF